MVFTESDIYLIAMSISTGFVLHMVFEFLYRILKNPLLGIFLYKDELEGENRRLKKFNKMLREDMREEIEKRDQVINALRNSLKSEIKTKEDKV